MIDVPPCLDQHFLGNLCPVQVKSLPTAIIFVGIDLLDTLFKNFSVTTSVTKYLHVFAPYPEFCCAMIRFNIVFALFSYVCVSFKDTLAARDGLCPFGCQGCDFAHQIWSPSDSPGRKWMNMMETFEQ